MVKMWNHKEVPLPFFSETPTHKVVGDGVATLAIKYLLGDVWKGMEGHAVTQHRAQLTLSGDYRTNSMLALSLLKFRTGMVWEAVPPSTDRFGQRDVSHRVEARYDSCASDAFPNLPRWIWVLFYEATLQPRIMGILLDKDWVGVWFIADTTTDLALGQVSRYFRVPEPRIRVGPDSSHQLIADRSGFGHYPNEYHVKLRTEDLETALVPWER